LALQKYERAANGMRASRLYDVAVALGVPVGFFFEDYGTPHPMDEALFPNHQLDKLIAAFVGLESPQIQQKFVDAALKMAAFYGGDEA
jgi:transcriptional regulator with XRE-family HTH domain